MAEKYFEPEEKYFVLDWMRDHCYGRENAKFRFNSADPDKGIMPFMPKNMGERKWRRIISELVQEAHIYSSASFGYFFMPLVSPTRADIEAAKQALTERKQKALSTIESVDKNLRRMEEKEQGVKELFPS